MRSLPVSSMLSILQVVEGSPAPRRNGGGAAAKGGMMLVGVFLCFLGTMVALVSIGLLMMGGQFPLSDPSAMGTFYAIVGVALGGGLFVVGMRCMGPATRFLVETE